MSRLYANTVEKMRAIDLAAEGARAAADDAPTPAEVEAVADASVSTHEAAGDPHPGYLTQAEGDVLYADVAHGHMGADITTLIIENRTSDPGSPETGRIWLRTDL